MKSEIDALKALKHPNIMSILDWSKDFTWYVMPLANGSLETEIKKLTATRFKKILFSCCSALDFAQQNGFVHRDIKPSNILKIGSGRAHIWVVSDWGLVSVNGQRSSQRLTLTGQALGTKDFAAPELESDAKNADYKCDIYSLGKVAQWGLNLIGRKGNGFSEAAAISKMTAYYPSSRLASYLLVKEALLGKGDVPETSPKGAEIKDDPIIDVFHCNIHFNGINFPAASRGVLECKKNGNLIPISNPKAAASCGEFNPSDSKL